MLNADKQNRIKGGKRMNKESLKDIFRGIIAVILVVATRGLDIYVLPEITEILWLVCGYMVCWIWNEED